MDKMRRDGCGGWVCLARAREAFAWASFASMAFCAAMAGPAAAAEKHEVTAVRNVAAKMRDGMTLRAEGSPPRAERSNSGSTSRGRVDSRRTPCGGARNRDTMRWPGRKCYR